MQVTVCTQENLVILKMAYFIRWVGGVTLNQTTHCTSSNSQSSQNDCTQLGFENLKALSF